MCIRDRCGSNLCGVVRRWKTRLWMRLTETIRKFISNDVAYQKKVCKFERWSRWSGDGDNRRGSSTARRLNRDQFKKIRRLRSSKNFTSERERSLYSIRSLAFSQCRNLRKRVACDNLEDLMTVPASEQTLLQTLHWLHLLLRSPYVTTDGVKRFKHSLHSASLQILRYTYTTAGTNSVKVDKK